MAKPYLVVLGAFTQFRHGYPHADDIAEQTDTLVFIAAEVELDGVLFANAIAHLVGELCTCDLACFTFLIRITDYYLENHIGLQHIELYTRVLGVVALYSGQVEPSVPTALEYSRTGLHIVVAVSTPFAHILHGENLVWLLARSRPQQSYGTEETEYECETFHNLRFNDVRCTII